MKKFLGTWLLAAMCAFGSHAADYGLPAEIQDGNILHCFNWTPTQVKAELANIAAAGFGAVQLSPLQRPDARIGENWHALYRPYDIAFKSSSFCTEQNLKELCSAAAEYGIKVIVDVVANHVDKTAGYHDTWWDSSGRVRWEGVINYGNRYSITHGQLGDYGDVNSENADVIARAKAYVEKLKSLGVKGIRWDAAKHIGLPSENCGFWTAVTSVAGMYHYGEILDSPGNDALIKEYAKYMSVTDNQYCDAAARYNGGVPNSGAGNWVNNQQCAASKMVYWGESHDTYSNNDGWSKNVDQATIDRAYAAMACRNGATALYLVRPDAKDFNAIKVGKGSNTAWKSKAIAEINKFRNAMNGRKDRFEKSGNTCAITREKGGAVIVTTGSGNVSVTNGGGYCPAGTYTDRVSGGKFTVTASTISGTVGSSGIAVIYNDGSEPVQPVEPVEPVNPVDPSSFTIYFDNTEANWTAPRIHYWSNPNTSWPGVEMTFYKDNLWSYTFSTDASTLAGFLFCNEGGADQTADYVGAPQNGHIYKGRGNKGAVSDIGTITVEQPIDPDGNFYIFFDNTPSGWATPHIHYWGNSASTWPGVAMTKVGIASRVDRSNLWQFIVPEGTTGILFNAGDGDATKTADFVAARNHVYTISGDTGETFINSSAIHAIDSDDTEVSVEWFSLQGQRIKHPTRGIYIRVTNKRAEKVIL